METLLKVDNIKKYYEVKGVRFWKRGYVKAVDGVSFEIAKGEFYGLIGESGCGKTTVGRILLGLIPPTSGHAFFGTQDILSLGKKELKAMRRKIQMIFQDPYSSMDSFYKVRQIVREPMLIHRLFSNAERDKIVNESMESVGLVPPENFLDKHPHELSGGQRQRVAIARALVLNPEFVVADEPVSNLDVSLRVGILKLMLNLREKQGFSCLYITHDLAIARFLCDYIATMYLGKIVERAPAEVLMENPLHPYTRLLKEATPTIEIDQLNKRNILAHGDIPDATNIPQGCRFNPRCKYARDICRKVEPELIEVEPSHYVACHPI